MRALAVQERQELAESTCALGKIPKKFIVEVPVQEAAAGRAGGRTVQQKRVGWLTHQQTCS